VNNNFNNSACIMPVSEPLASSVIATDNTTAQYVTQSLRSRAQGARQGQVTLPSYFYTGDEILQLELQAIFDKEWICIGRSDEVPEAGDYVTTQVLNEPLILLRDEQGDLQVLSNVCRHRCMKVADGSGKKARGFTCPYHAWSYDLKGKLIAAPRMKEDGFKMVDHDLAQVRFEQWQGFVYVNLDGKAEPLAPRLTGLDTILANYHTDQMLHHFSQEDVWHCNWKALVENFMEGYHLNCVHPQTLRPITPTSRAKKLPDGPGYTAYAANYNQGYEARKFKHEDLSGEEANRSSLFCVYPSHIASQSPHLLVYMAIQPLTSSSLKVRWGMSIRSLDMVGQGMDALEALWTRVNAEDKAKLEGLQATYSSRHAQAGPLAPEDLEGTIKDFHRYLARMLEH
jgi:phenylpropionate dioxygenase-like ring-hydroxylating dioxygenase large terminal subunit